LPKPFERALELAERGRGTDAPNPVVGAVVVAGDEVVGEGWHERAGGPHAEVVALEARRARARRDALRHARALRAPRPHASLRRRDPRRGIARVVVGAPDPNPKTGRPGFRASARGGVDVELLDGRQAALARRQNEAWRTWIAARRPFVTYKAAVTLDGRVVVPGRAG
jgi:diaminohydroxyphosphoribosylaminopyrimidine deaminase/5-amino-6-(5-phosphoribosylamino)uracil reductase